MVSIVEQRAITNPPPEGAMISGGAYECTNRPKMAQCHPGRALGAKTNDAQ